MAVNLYLPALVATAVVVAGIIGIKSRISSSIFEVAAGVVLTNFLGLSIEPWLDFLGTYGGLVLTFLAGAEVEFILLRKQANRASE